MKMVADHGRDLVRRGDRHSAGTEGPNERRSLLSQLRSERPIQLVEQPAVVGRVIRALDPRGRRYLPRRRRRGVEPDRVLPGRRFESRRDLKPCLDTHGVRQDGSQSRPADVEQPQVHRDADQDVRRCRATDEDVVQGIRRVIIDLHMRVHGVASHAE